MKTLLLLIAFASSARSQFSLSGGLGRGGLGFSAGLGGTRFSAGFGGLRADVDKKVSVENLLEEEWSAFKSTYNKTYATAEENLFRMENFVENRFKIAKFNQEFGRGQWNFAQQLNNFADMLGHEFNKFLNGFNNNLRSKIRIPPASTFIPSANVVYPDYVDWREVGAVTPVKSQGDKCACCWAFAAAGALEGHNFRKTGRLVELSPQDLIDCSTKQGNEGCAGGLLEPAYEYVRVNPGVDTDSSYPYEARDGECRFRQETIGGECTGYVAIPSGDEKALEAAVATLGPVSVAIDAGRPTFQFYKEGIYFDPDCTNRAEELNHAVLVVGYGTEPDGKKYWLVKNSYGPYWGIGGYVKMAKDANNHCGIATQATYPLVAHKKQYATPAEEAQRLKIFQDNLVEIEAHNEKYAKGEVTYKKDINQFGDLTKEEFLAYVNRGKSSKPQFPGKYSKPFVAAKAPTASSVDWRNQGAVSGVKNQGQCGSCWSFSATGAIEGQLALSGRGLTSLSEQNLMDCSTSYGNQGCNGGWMDSAFDYVHDYGIESERDYPYEAYDGYCRFNRALSVTSVSGYYDIPYGSESSLQQAVGQAGPVAVAIDATDELQFYSGGVFYDRTCNERDLNHGVLV
ncbi:cathepsin L1, partial [Asbolus verrucosus]